MAIDGSAKARAQWIAAAMREEKERLERRQKLMGELYDEVGKYVAAIMEARRILGILTDEHDVRRGQIRELFGLSDREVGVLYGTVRRRSDDPISACGEPYSANNDMGLQSQCERTHEMDKQSHTITNENKDIDINSATTVDLSRL